MRKNDILLLIAVLLIAAAVGLCFNLTSQNKDFVVIEKNGTELARLPLEKNAEYTVENSNRIVIENGKVYMAYADCPDKLCVKQGAIEKSGIPIVCLPNKVTVSIQGKD